MELIFWTTIAKNKGYVIEAAIKAVKDERD
jgi:hypothetical protein